MLALVLASTAFAADDIAFVNEGVLNAPIEEVWKIWTTSDGYRKLGPALADVDLRIGGLIRSRYRGDGRLGDDETIENEIMAFEPPRMIAIRIHKPPKSFPFKESWKKTWTVITLIPLEGGKTRVRAASLGYGTDEESVAMMRFFQSGNQQTIEALQKYFNSSRH